MTDALATDAGELAGDDTNDRTRVYLLAGLAGLGVLAIILSAVRRATSSAPAPASGTAPAPAADTWAASLKHVCDNFEQRLAGVADSHDELARALIDLRARVDQLAGPRNVVEPGTDAPLPAPTPAATSGDVETVELPPFVLEDVDA